MKNTKDPKSNNQKTESSEKLVKQNANSASNKADVKALKDQNAETKDSDHKNENAANAKDNSGHYK